MTKANNVTRAHLLRHYEAYPCLQAEDVFKFLFQSALGCEHLVSDEERALRYIKSEYETVPATDEVRIEPLDGAYSRVYLSFLKKGLSPTTLARLFCLSARKEPDGKALLEEKLAVAQDLIGNGALPLDKEDFARKLAEWRALGFPAVRHSEQFRACYRPAYRVISNRYVELLQVFCAIDRLLCKGNATVAIEGGSASGKSTLAALLQTVYDCNVLHMDDFFLRPEQRTQERLAEIGGNLDRERFLDEVLRPLQSGDIVRYRPFDCFRQALGDTVTVPPKQLTVIEGVYSMHPAFGEYYDLALFLEIDQKTQRDRIEVRNSPSLAKRFFEEWIPMENVYFSEMQIKDRASLILPVKAP